MKVHILGLINFDALNVVWYLFDSFEELPLHVVLGVFDDATGEVNSVYLFLFRFKASEFVGVQFPHDASSEFQEILKGHHWFGTKDAVSFSDDNFQELFPTWVELSGLDVNWLSNESVIICADMIEHD